MASISISKLTEAAWIQDCRTPRRRHGKTMELFEQYCAEVHEIIQLRYFKTSGIYDLVGISTDILRQVLDLPISAFNPDGPTIDIPIGDKIPDFTLKFNRADSKVTLANILKSNCVVHAAWSIPNS